MRTPLDRWREWHAFYDRNPFRVSPGQIDRNAYEDLARRARESISPDFLDRVRRVAGPLPDPEWLHGLALRTQILQRPEGGENNYAHGFLLYALVHAAAASLEGAESLVVLETGSARGFSAVCMARSLEDANRAGTILSIDVLHADRPIFWNSISDLEGPCTRLELLDEWRDLIRCHVVFVRGLSEIVIEQLGLSRVHFAFLDGAHDYEHVRQELDFVARRQEPGDRVLCDDYSEETFPGIVRAVDEAVADSRYSIETIRSSPRREYALLRRQS